MSFTLKDGVFGSIQRSVTGRLNIRSMSVHEDDTPIEKTFSSYTFSGLLEKYSTTYDLGSSGLSTGNSRWVTINPANVSSDYDPLILPRAILSSAGWMRIYELPSLASISGGTSVAAQNRNRQSPPASEWGLLLNPTVSLTGSVILESQNVASDKDFGVIPTPIPWESLIVCDKSKPTAIEIRNTGANLSAVATIDVVLVRRLRVGG